MFGFGKKKKLRDDLPAIDIRRKSVKGFFGKAKWVPASKREQRKIKELLMQKYPDRYMLMILTNGIQLNREAHCRGLTKLKCSML